MMMDGFNIDTIPSSRKIYYTASYKITPQENSLGSKVQLNMYDATTMNGVLVTESDITTIGLYAFYRCHSLTSLTIPDSVTSIGNRAFCECYNLTTITIPDSVTSIDISAFRSCNTLTSITIPNSVTSIKSEAFYECLSLTSITIPDSVKSIGNYVFSYCKVLTSVYCKATTPPLIGTNVFRDNGSDRKIYVPMESVDVYKSATNWSEYADAIEGYEF